MFQNKLSVHNLQDNKGVMQVAVDTHKDEGMWKATGHQLLESVSRQRGVLMAKVHQGVSPALTKLMIKGSNLLSHLVIIVELVDKKV